MLFQAAKEYDLDLSKCLFVGDDERDLEAGQSAGCKTIIVDAEWPLIKVVNERVIGA